MDIPAGNAALAAVDTGTTLIGAPSAAAEAIWAQVPGSALQMQGQFQGFYTFRMSRASLPRGQCADAQYASVSDRH